MELLAPSRCGARRHPGVRWAKWTALEEERRTRTLVAGSEGGLPPPHDDVKIKGLADGITLPGGAGGPGLAGLHWGTDCRARAEAKIGKSAVAYWRVVDPGGEAPLLSAPRGTDLASGYRY